MKTTLLSLLGAGLLAAAISVPAQSPVKDVVVIVDNSGSMKKNDPGFLAKQAVTEFITKLSGDTRAQIIIFDEKVRVAVPFTEVNDGTRDGLIASLAGIDYRGKFTDSPAAVERAVYDLKTLGREGAERAIVFMTDGIVDTGDKAKDARSTDWLRQDLSADAADAGIRIFAVAYTENADFQLIQSLAQRTKGEYFRALSAAELPAVFDKILEAIRVGVAPPTATTLPPAVTTPSEPPPAAAPIPPDTATRTGATMPEDLAPGTVVIEPPPPTTAEKWVGLAIVVVAGLGVGGLIFGAVLLLRRRAPAALAAAPVPPDVPKAYLNDINKITSDPAYEIGAKPVMLGRVAGTERDLDHIVINQTTVGRRHALIEYKNFNFWITDQGSVNGTFVNGERITTERLLKHGDRVRLHNFEFEFLIPELEESGKTVFSGSMGEMADKTLVATSSAALAGAAAAPAPAARAPTAVADDDDFLDITGTAATRSPATAPPAAVAPPAPRVELDDDFDFGAEPPAPEPAKSAPVAAAAPDVGLDEDFGFEAEPAAPQPVTFEPVPTAVAGTPPPMPDEPDDSDITIDDFMNMDDGGDDTEMLAAQAPTPAAAPVAAAPAPDLSALTPEPAAVEPEPTPAAAASVPFHELDTFVRDGVAEDEPADVTMDAFISTTVFDRRPQVSSESPTVTAYKPPSKPEIGSEDPTIRPAIPPAAVRAAAEDATVSPFIPVVPDDADAEEELSLEDFMDSASLDKDEPADPDRTRLMVEDNDRTKLMVEDNDRTRLMDDNEDDRTLMPDDVPDPRSRRR